jgi:hypothetical protein
VKVSSDDGPIEGLQLAIQQSLIVSVGAHDGRPQVLGAVVLQKLGVQPVVHCDLDCAEKKSG